MGAAQNFNSSTVHNKCQIYTSFNCDRDILANMDIVEVEDTQK